MSSSGTPRRSIQVLEPRIGSCVNYFHLGYAEPIGSSPPNVPKDSKGNIYSFTQSSQVSLTCPAQAFPIAAFRYLNPDNRVLFKSIFTLSIQNPLAAHSQMFPRTLRAPFTASPRVPKCHWHVKLRPFLLLHSGTWIQTARSCSNLFPPWLYK